MKTLEEIWFRFAKEVIPEADAPMRQAFKKTFYLGARSCLTLLSNGAAEGGVDAVKAVRRELTEFEVMHVQEWRAGASDIAVGETPTVRGKD